MHPRSRGATPAPGAGTGRSAGLSPLTRGNRGDAGPPHPSDGPIPAHAGQPGGPVHRAASRRPIPAHAGQPNIHRSRCSGRGAYPRSRGATRPANCRVRGGGAYPRSRGATSPHAQVMLTSPGLSPLTRGNPRRSSPGGAGRGPIPAHAGQPRRGGTSARGWWAYPRSRGATPLPWASDRGMRGLSPLTRGNLDVVFLDALAPGPIPAHAGQPTRSGGQQARARAYPRSRGATARGAAPGSGATGLSPLTRGNRKRSVIVAHPFGPIPAHAGQPAAGRRTARSWRAYPRSRGATPWPQGRRGLGSGLSPLTRGNRVNGWSGRYRSGPIPAHAGQP